MENRRPSNRRLRSPDHAAVNGRGSWSGCQRRPQFMQTYCWITMLLRWSMATSARTVPWHFWQWMRMLLMGSPLSDEWCCDPSRTMPAVHAEITENHKRKPAPTRASERYRTVRTARLDGSRKPHASFRKKHLARCRCWRSRL